MWPVAATDQVTGDLGTDGPRPCKRKPHRTGPRGTGCDQQPGLRVAATPRPGLDGEVPGRPCGFSSWPGRLTRPGTQGQAHDHDIQAKVTATAPDSDAGQPARVAVCVQQDLVRRQGGGQTERGLWSEDPGLGGCPGGRSRRLTSTAPPPAWRVRDRLDSATNQGHVFTSAQGPDAGLVAFGASSAGRGPAPLARVSTRPAPSPLPPPLGRDPPTRGWGTPPSATGSRPAWLQGAMAPPRDPLPRSREAELSSLGQVSLPRTGECPSLSRP